jgi:hypothetical protein
MALIEPISAEGIGGWQYQMMLFGNARQLAVRNGVISDHLAGKISYFHALGPFQRQCTGLDLLQAHPRGLLRKFLRVRIVLVKEPSDCPRGFCSAGTA